MFHLGIHGRHVPEWLQKMEPKNPARPAASKIGTLTFRGLCVVYQRQGRYVVRPVFSQGAVMTIRNCEHVEVRFQKPAGSAGGDVLFNMRPLIPRNALFLSGIVAGFTYGQFK